MVKLEEDMPQKQKAATSPVIRRQRRNKKEVQAIVSKHTLLIHFLLKYQLPKGSINFPNNGTSWGSSVQTHAPMGEIIYLNHSTNVFFTDKYVLTNLQ